MAEWEPIETAPKNRRKVLIFHAANDDGDCYKIAYWSDLAARPGWFHRGGWLEESEPDGWMPLPDPPSVIDPQSNFDDTVADGGNWVKPYSEGEKQ